MELINSQHKKSVLVTGGTGMLGSRLILDLVNTGYHVKALFRNKKRIEQFKKNVRYHDTENKLDNEIDWIEGDVLDYVSILDASKNIDIVYHSAAMVSFNPADYNEMINVNVNGTANIVNASIENEVPRFCFVSSIAALGKAKDGLYVDEETKWIPDRKHSGYSKSKFYSEMEIWRGINEGLNAVIVNPSVILGPGEWNSGSPAFFKNVYTGLKFFTKGVTGFVDVKDVSKAMILLSSDEHFEMANRKRFLLNSANISFAELFSLIAQALNVKEPPYFASDLMLEIAWRASWLLSKIIGTSPLITSESIASANKVAKYDGSLISKTFNFNYEDIEDTIRNYASIYLNEQEKSRL